MATSNAPCGMNHPTVVPANFESVEGATGTDGGETGDGEDRGGFGSDDADGTVPGAGPR